MIVTEQPTAAEWVEEHGDYLLKFAWSRSTRELHKRAHSEKLRIITAMEQVKENTER